MIYKGLGLITNTESPIVVVLRYVDLSARCYCSRCAERVCTSNRNLSGSMEPAFYRGDILFLVNPPNMRYEIGDITVYKIPGQDIPIVHRVLETHDVVKVVNGSVFTKVTLCMVINSSLALYTAFARLRPALKISCYLRKGTITTWTM
jgi:signal peptidase I